MGIFENIEESVGIVCNDKRGGNYNRWTLNLYDVLSNLYCIELGWKLPLALKGYSIGLDKQNY